MMDTNHWVDAAPFRRHVRWLIGATGLSWRLIAAHADVAPRAVRTLLHGRPHTGKPVDRIHIDIARALMGLDLDDLVSADDRETCAGDARTLFATLMTLGYSPNQLSIWLTAGDLQVLSNRWELWCSAGTRARVQACHDLLTGHPDRRPATQRAAPSRERHTQETAPGSAQPAGVDGDSGGSWIAPQRAALNV